MEQEQKKHAGGRPSDYLDEYAEQAFNYTLLGATLEQMAGFFGVGLATIKRWMKAHEEFRAAIKKGGAEADGVITKSLYQRAKGYQIKEVSYEQISTKEQLLEVSELGNIEMKEGEPMYKVKVSIKDVAADTTAQIYWLKNRQPVLWRDKKEVQLDGNVSFHFESDPTNEPLNDDEETH